MEGVFMRQPVYVDPLMEDEDEDVFSGHPHLWHTHFREIKYKDRGTQTPGPALSLGNGMLPFGLAEEPRRLFHGNAAFRLHFPAHFERVGEAMPEDQQGQADRHHQWPSVEAQIGQKLQMIGDQFHQEHVQQHHRNQRWRRQPFLWRLAFALYTLIFERDAVGVQGRGLEQR
uniref:Uncharacterized protein n=1 Tax=Denticeps clupeoides TaxID=299321 RepID=A0AAY4CKH2_9TELE